MPSTELPREGAASVTSEATAAVARTAPTGPHHSIRNDTAIDDEEGDALEPAHSRSKSRSRSIPAVALSALLRPGDMASRGAPPPEAFDMSRVPSSAPQPAAEQEGEAPAQPAPTQPQSNRDSSQTSTGSVHPDEKTSEQQETSAEDPQLTAFQYSDGRVKIQHPGMGDRMRTYYPHEIKRIGGKNDLLKSNTEKAIEGEAQLRPNDEGKIVLTERAGYLATGYSFPTWKKWMALFFTALIQVSMNYNTSCYSNAVPGITEKFHVSAQAARVGQMIYLVAYSFGCELWAPWSEEFGRKPILQLSLTLVNCAYPLCLCLSFI